MAKYGLFDYAADHPITEPVCPVPASEQELTIAERQEEIAQAHQLQASILRQLEQGNEPQAILYTAVSCIGKLCHDEEWADQAHGIIDSVYGDLAQRSLLRDDDAIAEQRMHDMQTAFNDRTRRRLETQLRDTQKLTKALQDILAGLPGYST